MYARCHRGALPSSNPLLALPLPPRFGERTFKKKKWFPEGLQWSVTSVVFCVRRHFNKKFGRRTPRSSTLHRFTNPSVTAWIWSTSSHQDRISTPSLCTTEGKLAREIFVLAPPRRDQHLCLRRKCCVLRIFLRALLVLVDISLASRAPGGGDSESREESRAEKQGNQEVDQEGRPSFRLRIQERTELRSRDRDQSPRSCGTARAWLVAVRLDDSTSAFWLGLLRH